MQDLNKELQGEVSPASCGGTDLELQDIESYSAHESYIVILTVILSLGALC